MRSISKRITSPIFLNICSTATCFDSCNSLYFKIIDKANPNFDLRIKEALHINWSKLSYSYSYYYSFCSPCSFLPLFVFLFLFFCNSLSSIVFIISTPFIGTLYCLNYTLLLLHLFMTHLVTDFIILYN